jgi:hypothetical protein
VHSEQINNDWTPSLLLKQVRALSQACVYLPQVLSLIILKKTTVAYLLFMFTVRSYQ